MKALSLQLIFVLEHSNYYRQHFPASTLIGIAEIDCAWPPIRKVGVAHFVDTDGLNPFAVIKTIKIADQDSLKLFSCDFLHHQLSKIQSLLVMMIYAGATSSATSVSETQTCDNCGTDRCPSFECSGGNSGDESHWTPKKVKS